MTLNHNCDCFSGVGSGIAGNAYVVQVPDYGDGHGGSEKFDLRDFPNIYRLISA